MKKLMIMMTAAVSLLMTACTKNEVATFTENQVEWDAAAWNANSAGLTYPMMTRVPIYGFATPTSSPSITRNTGTVRLRVNVLGPQAASDRSFKYQFNQAESSAVPGTHFEAVSGNGTIPANSSFGFVDLKILNPGAGTGSATVVLQLIESPDFKAATNYAKIGISISQL